MKYELYDFKYFYKTICLTLAVFIFATAGVFAQKFDSLALTPPMGWNSWNKFGCDVNEKLVKEIADAMVSSGMSARTWSSTGASGLRS